MAKFFFSKNYNHSVERIEDHIFSTTNSLDLVNRFHDEHDKVLQFIESNPNTPAVHPVTGDQTWQFGDGRYRLFFRARADGKNLSIYLTHLIDNRESNLDIYPGNTIPTYDEE